MSELRASFLLNLGELLVIGDRYSEDDINGVQTIYSSGELEAIVSDPRDVIIHKFCARKNTGEQPCGDDVPVCASYFQDDANKAGSFDWAVSDSKYSIKTWQPDLEALIKMQDEHDKEQAKPCASELFEGEAINHKRTKTECVKVEFNKLSEAFAEHEANPLYDYHLDSIAKPLTDTRIVKRFNSGAGFWRKVECEITWQDEVVELYDDGVTLNTTLRDLIDMNSEVVINISHLVASMTDNK